MLCSYMCIYAWMLVMCIMCILFVAMGLHARDMDFHVHTTHMWEVIGYCAVHVLMYALLGCGLADHFFPWSVGKLGFLFQRSVRRHCFWNASWLLGFGSVLVSVYMYIVLYVCVIFWKGCLCVFFLWHFIAVLSPSLGLAICKSGILYWVYTWC